MNDVDALIAFAAVIDTGSFSAAAARLGQTPSGVSRIVSRLEAQRGMTLMVRTTRRLDLTEEGSWLLARARCSPSWKTPRRRWWRAARSRPAWCG